MFPDEYVAYSVWDYIGDLTMAWAVLGIGLCLLVLAAMLVLLFMFRDRSLTLRRCVALILQSVKDSITGLWVFIRGECFDCRRRAVRYYLRKGKGNVDME